MQWDFKEAGKNKQTNKGIQRTLSGRNEDRKSHLMPKGSLTLKEQQQESLLAATFFFFALETNLDQKAGTGTKDLILLPIIPEVIWDKTC